MSKQFAVRKLDALLAPKFCGFYEWVAPQGALAGFIVGEYTAGLGGYYMLACYLWG